MEFKLKENNTNRQKGISLLVFLIILMGIWSCTYDIKEMTAVEIPDSVSFKNNIIPFFEADCAKSGCHVTGSLPPDLTAENAYVSLTVYGYVELDTSKAEESIIYKKITNGGSMEKYVNDPNQSELLLKWIKQGSKNN
jgi:hypothetical protein